MDSSKILEECSSSESGWTMYIASPDRRTEYHDGDDDDDDGVSNGVNGYKKEDLDSDDSMASDASSGPSDLYGHVGKSHAGKYVGKKVNEQEEKKKQIKKAEKDKSGNRVKNAGKSKKNV